MSDWSPEQLGEVSAVIVLYNSADVIEACLASLPGAAEVILVDNASTDDGLARARCVRPDAIVCQSWRNLGFGGGCNLGWRASSRPFIAFINPDVRLRDGSLGVLVDRLAKLEHFVVGPCLVDSHGDPRRCKRRPSAVVDALGLLPANARWARRGWDGKLAPDDPRHTTGGPVACVEGACFVARRSDLIDIGGFDEDFFLYYEEESIGLRMERFGGGAEYEPRAVADHAGATSTRKVGSVAIRQLHRSRVVFYRKRDGNLYGELKAVMLAMAVLISLPAAALNSLPGRRRSMTLDHAWQVWRGLLAGMAAKLHTDLDYSPRAAAMD